MPKLLEEYHNSFILEIQTPGPEGPPGIAGSESGAGLIFITDITPADPETDIVAGKVYDPASILVSCISNTDMLNIHVESSFPKILLNGGEFILTRAGTGYLFTGSVTIDLAGGDSVHAVAVTPHNEGGASVTCAVDVMQGPAVVSAVLGAYPAGQTEMKAGDTMTVSGSCDVTAVFVRIVGGDGDLFGAEDWTECSGGVFTITGTATANTGVFSTSVQLRDAAGLTGPIHTTSDTRTLNQTTPAFIDSGVTYPAGQTAFKGTEPGISAVTVSDSDTVTYFSPNSDFTITNSAAYEQNKQITCTNPGSYNDSAINFRIVANRSANGMTAVFEKIIEVADCAPVITVTQPETRLRSPETHTITASASQNLAAAPLIDAPVSGTWEGAGFTGTLKVWTRNIIIDDNDARGTGAWTLAIPVTNRAGIPAIISGSQVVGGFTSRKITFPALAVENAAGVSVTDVSKLICYDTGGELMTFHTDLADHIKGFSITGPAGTYNASGNLLYWCDVAQREANLTGNDFFILEESV